MLALLAMASLHTRVSAVVPGCALTEDLQIETSDEREHVTFVFVWSGLPHSMWSFLVPAHYLQIFMMSSLFTAR